MGFLKPNVSPVQDAIAAPQKPPKPPTQANYLRDRVAKKAGGSRRGLASTVHTERAGDGQSLSLLGETGNG